MNSPQHHIPTALVVACAVALAIIILAILVNNH